MTDDDKREQEATRRSREEAAEKLSKGKPTPTQAENDRTASGEHVAEHEDDGSGPDPGLVVQTRHIDSRRPPSSYSTRASRAAPSPKTDE